MENEFGIPFFITKVYPQCFNRDPLWGSKNVNTCPTSWCLKHISKIYTRPLYFQYLPRYKGQNRQYFSPIYLGLMCFKISFTIPSTFVVNFQAFPFLYFSEWQISMFFLFYLKVFLLSFSFFSYSKFLKFFFLFSLFFLMSNFSGFLYPN